MFLSYEPDFRLSVEKSVDNIVVFFNLEQCTRYLMCIINAFLYVGGCLFYGRVYSTGEEILIKLCLAKMNCLSSNNLSTITPL